jgi:SAM-dependent methyltransferase
MATFADRSMSFGAIAGDYDRLRASPPPAAVDWLLPERRSVVVDLAAGTGLLSRALTGKAGRVIAVEPDARMRAVLTERSPGVEVLAGRGEDIPLPAASADAVLVSSAWHWLDPDLAVPEIARVLRDGGRFGVVWGGRDRSTPWIRAEEWFQVGGRDSPTQEQRTRDTGAPGATLEWDGRRVTLPEPGIFDNIETATFRYGRMMTIPDLVDMLATYSRVITASAEVREAGRARAAAALAQEFPGATQVEVPMRARCWRADRVPR